MIGREPPDFVEFVYLAPYERFAKHEIPDEVERAFEAEIVQDPEIGRLVPGLGGVRKVRVALPGRGKRGGARFLYFVCVAQERVYVLTAYAKNVQSDLTPDQRRLILQILDDLE
jgi:hypothetical protein